MDLGGRFPPARSIPNLPNETCSIAQSTEPYALARCSSHPAEMWGRDVMENQHIQCDSPEYMRTMKMLQQQQHHQQSFQPQPPSIGVTTATQTDTAIDLSVIERFVLTNPRLILNMLGIIEPTVQIECELQPQTLIPIPEGDISSPDISSPHDAATEFSFATAEGSQSAPWSPQNSTNRNGGENSRSTDALLVHSSDDCLKASDTSLNNITESVNFNIIKEGSFRGKRRNHSSTSDCGGNGGSHRSNSSNSLSSTGNTPRASTSDLLLQRHNSGSSGHGSNNGGLNRKHSWKESNSRMHMIKQPTVTENPSADDLGDDCNPDYDELSEKCALLCNDVRKNSRASTTDIQKRTHHLGMPRPPFSYRFSAGDADKLEKGIRNIPSTRSLKES